VSKNLKILIGVLLALVLATPAMAMKLEFHGDLNNRFLLYTDQSGFFQVSGPVLDKDDRPDSFGEIKSRLIVSAATDDGAVKGVYALEVGAIKFGQAARGGSFSGDGLNLETRWFFTDFQIPGVASKARVQIGLFSNTVNRFFWSETAMGVKFYGDNWYLAWLRGKDQFQSTSGNQDWRENDLDTLNARYDLKMDPVKVGFFASYLTQRNDDTSITLNPATANEIKLFPNANFDLLAVGIDGGVSAGTSFGKVFLNWDLIYETGGVDDVGSAGNDVDIKGYLAHADLGLNFGAATVTLTSWYASGDDNSSDRDFDNFFSVDVDLFESFIFQESLTDDNVFFEGGYIRDKGMFFNKLALDFQATKQTKVGLAGLYLQTAKDLEWSTFKEKNLGVEIDGYVRHKLYDNLELALHLGYLFSGDAMDFFETSASQNGKSDVDIFKSEAMVRYQF
jgi:hypothetical protein